MEEMETCWTTFAISGYIEGGLVDGFIEDTKERTKNTSDRMIPSYKFQPSLFLMKDTKQ